MEKLINECIGRRTWAVVGASNDASKYGNRIFRKLMGRGYNVYGVNPKGGMIDNHQLYPDLKSLADKVKYSELVVDVVVPPAVTEKIVEECKDLGINMVWMQPGAESDKAVKFCQDHDIGVIHGGPCAMVLAGGGHD